MRYPPITLVLIVGLVLCVVAGRLAMYFNRRFGTWVLLSLWLSPIITLTLLFILGEHKERTLEEKEEQLREQHPERNDIHQAALNEMNCPHCGADVNPITKDGLHAPDREPWLLICNRCEGAIEPDV